jgi:hypothetical protein
VEPELGDPDSSIAVRGHVSVGHGFRVSHPGHGVLRVDLIGQRIPQIGEAFVVGLTSLQVPFSM